MTSPVLFDRRIATPFAIKIWAIVAIGFILRSVMPFATGGSRFVLEPQGLEPLL